MAPDSSYATVVLALPSESAVKWAKIRQVLISLLKLLQQDPCTGRPLRLSERK